MAVFEATIERAVALELKQKVLTLYAEVLPIVTTLATWTLNGIDPALPTPYEVKIQLDAYQALVIDRLKLTDWVTALIAAQPADFLTYPTPPVYFDGGAGIFDGGGNPEE